MIQRKDLLAFDFYKAEKFTGSFCGMRYLIQKTEENDETKFTVYTWLNYGFAATKEEKAEKTFPFIEESLNEIADYLNQVYEKGKEKW